MSRSQSNSKWRLQVFQGVRLLDPIGNEFQTKSEDLFNLVTLLALSRDNSIHRFDLAELIYGTEVETRSTRLKVLLSRVCTSLNKKGESFIKYSSDFVWFDIDKIEVDINIVDDLLNQIYCNSTQGKNVGGLIERLGQMISPLDHISNLLPLSRATAEYQKRLLHAINARIAPILGIKYANSINALLDVLELDVIHSPYLCSIAMQIYSCIGEETEIHRLFALHEEYVQNEFGSTVSKAVLSAYELALSMPPSTGMDESIQTTPPLVTESFGFEALVEKLIALFESTNGRFTHTLVGSPGAGKTHTLALLFNAFRDININAIYLDLNIVTSIDQVRRLKLNDVRVLLLDNVNEANTTLSRSISTYLKPQFTICTNSDSKACIQELYTKIPRLNVGNRILPGPAVKLFLATLNQRIDTLQTEPTAVVNEILELTEGLPKQIKDAAKMTISIGPQATLNFLTNELSILSRFSDINDLSPRGFTLSQITELSKDSLIACRIIQKCGGKIHPQLLLDCTRIHPCSISELEFKGFVYLNESGVCCMTQSLMRILDSYPDSELEPHIWKEYVIDVAVWLAKRVGENVSDKILYADLTSFWEPIRWLLNEPNPLDGINAFYNLSKWFGSNPVPNDIIKFIESQLIVENEIDSESWWNYMYSVSKAHFSNGYYEDVIRIHEYLMESEKLKTARPVIQCKYLVLIGIINHWERKFESAKSYFVGALKLSQSDNEKCNIYFNLGCICENQLLHREAIEYHSKAAALYDIDQDPRLITYNTSALLRNKLKVTPESESIKKDILNFSKDKNSAMDFETKAILLIDVGIVLFENGNFIHASYYLIIGLLYYFQFGIKGGAARKSIQCMNILIKCLDRLQLIESSKYVKCLRYGIRYLADARHNTEEAAIKLIPMALSDLFAQILSNDLGSLENAPEEITHLISDCKLLKLDSAVETPLIPYLESIKQLNNSPLEDSLVVTVSEDSIHISNELSNNGPKT